MRYELRTRFSLSSADPMDEEGMGSADRLLQWLCETLPTKASLGSDVAPARWLGNRYTEREIEFELVTQYRDVFAVAADRLRIAAALGDLPARLAAPDSVAYEVMRVYGDAELVDLADPSKKATHPC